VKEEGMKEKIIEVSVAAIAILSLCAAMSDGPYFPLPNWIGMGILAIIAYFVNRPPRQYRERPPICRQRRVVG
jgi:hypothetical protein